jgi:pimeloyl-ACP methyl ester carboxylesterase
MPDPAITDELIHLGGATLYVRRLHASLEPLRVTRPTIVLLHDSLGCVETWRDFPEVLAKAVGFNAVVYDRQGYGRSSPFGPMPRTLQYLEEEAQVLRGLLDALEIDSAILFGHSDGGSIALIAAAMEPTRIAAVVTEGAHVFVEDVTLRGIREAQESLGTTDLAQRLARYHGDKVPALTAAWIDTWLSPEFRSWNIERYLPDIRCPVLVTQGERDEFGTVEQVNAIVRGVGALAKPLMIPDIGHTPHRDAREAVLEAASAFVAAATNADG